MVRSAERVRASSVRRVTERLDASRDRANAEAHLRLAHAGMEYRQVLLWFSRPHPHLGGARPDDADPVLLSGAAAETARTMQHRFQPSTPGNDDECFVCDLAWLDGPHDDTPPTTDAA